MKRLGLLFPLLLLSCSGNERAFDYELRVCTMSQARIASDLTAGLDFRLGPCEPYAPLTGNYRTTKKHCAEFADMVERVKSMEEGVINAPRRWRATCVYIGEPK